MRRGTGQPGAGTGGEGEVAAEAAAGAVVVASYAPQAADRGRSPAAGCLSANQGITSPQPDGLEVEAAKAGSTPQSIH